MEQFGTVYEAEYNSERSKRYTTYCTLKEYSAKANKMYSYTKKKHLRLSTYCNRKVFWTANFGNVLYFSFCVNILADNTGNVCKFRRLVYANV